MARKTLKKTGILRAKRERKRYRFFTPSGPIFLKNLYRKMSLAFFAGLLALFGQTLGSVISGGLMWAYLKGSTSVNPGGTYGHVGEYDPTTVPQAQYASGFTTDIEGTCWLLEFSCYSAVFSWNGMDWRLSYYAASCVTSGVYSGPSPRPASRRGSTLWPRRNGPGFVLFGGYGNSVFLRFAAPFRALLFLWLFCLRHPRSEKGVPLPPVPHSDVWEFNGTAWTLLSGDAGPHYATGAAPAGRCHAVGWTDGGGNVIL